MLKKELHHFLKEKKMDRKFVTLFFVVIYLVLGFSIMGLVNGFSDAKWFDGGLDLIYGVILIYLTVLLYYSYKIDKNKNLFYVVWGFVVIILERVFQIFLQEFDLKTNYNLTVVSWGWIAVDIFMVFGFLLIIKGLWGIKND